MVILLGKDPNDIVHWLPKHLKKPLSTRILGTQVTVKPVEDYFLVLQRQWRAQRELVLRVVTYMFIDMARNVGSPVEWTNKTYVLTLSDLRRSQALLGEACALDSLGLRFAASIDSRKIGMTGVAISSLLFTICR